MRLQALLFIGMFLLGVTQIANAQTQLNNSDFETWVNQGTDSIEPTDWNSFMTARGVTIIVNMGKKQQIDKSTDVRPLSAGTSSCLIWSRPIPVGIDTVVANGNVTTGRINMGNIIATNADNYNITLTAQPKFSEAIGAKPDSIVFWTKFKPYNSGSTDSARMRAVIHDSYDYRDPSGSDVNAPNHLVGSATRHFATTSNQWARMGVPFSYGGPATSPDYILVTFTTNKTAGGGSGGDSLWIDDLSLVYNGASISENKTIDPSENFFVYTDDNDIIIDLSFDKLQTSKIEMFNMSGQLVYKTQITAQTVQHFIGLNKFESGIYVITANTDDGRKFSQKVYIK